jgi:hypothetical protein
VLLHITSHRFRCESALFSDPEGIQPSAVNNALDGTLRNVKVIGYLLRSPKAFGRLSLPSKPLLEFLDLVVEVLGYLFKFLDAILGTDPTVWFVFGAAGTRFHGSRSSPLTGPREVAKFATCTRSR